MKKGTQTTITTVIFLSLAMLFTSIILVETTTKQLVYAQNATSSNQTPTSSNVTTTTTAAGVTDFKTLRDGYFAQWQQLNFQSGFDTFVEYGSVQGYGVYKEHPSNIFTPDTSSISLYVEPIGYGYEERVDEKGTVLYSFNFTATINISDKQGKPVTEPILAEFGEPLNSHKKATEAFMPLTLTVDQPLPIGEYTITYTINDGKSGKSFEIVKDIKVAETVS